MRKLRRGRKRWMEFRMVTLVGEREPRIRVRRERRGSRKNRAGNRGRSWERMRMGRWRICGR